MTEKSSPAWRVERVVSTEPPVVELAQIKYEADEETPRAGQILVLKEEK